MLYVGVATVFHDSLHSSSLGDSPQQASAAAAAEQRFSMGHLCSTLAFGNVCRLFFKLSILGNATGF